MFGLNEIFEILTSAHRLQAPKLLQLVIRETLKCFIKSSWRSFNETVCIKITKNVNSYLPLPATSLKNINDFYKSDILFGNRNQLVVKQHSLV